MKQKKREIIYDAYGDKDLKNRGKSRRRRVFKERRKGKIMIEGIGLGWGRRAMMRLEGEGEGERDGLWLLALSRLTALYKRYKKGG